MAIRTVKGIAYEKLSVNVAWTLEIPTGAIGRVPASVPGSVYHDLLTAGLIPDIFHRDNEMDTRKLTRLRVASISLFTAGRPYLRVDTSHREQRAMPAYEEPGFYRGFLLYVER